MMKVSSSYWFVVRCAVALVWFYQGAWLKVLAVDPHHLSIVESAISFGHEGVWLGLIGAFETFLGIWFLTGWRSRSCAVVQILLLFGMNAGGILFAGDQIPDIPGMVFMNLVFVLAIAGAGGLWREENEA